MSKKEKPETKICKKCKTEIPYSAKVCPQCRSKQGMSLWLKVLIVLLVIGVIGAFAGGSSDSETPTNGNDTVQEEKKEDFMIEGDVTTSKDMFSLYIEGVIKNNTDEDKSYVQVTFNLFDADGNQIGTALDNINNLKAGGTWKFKAIGLDAENAVSYELAEITGW